MEVLLLPVSSVLHGHKRLMSRSSRFGLGKESWCMELEVGWATGPIWMYMKVTISPAWTRIQTLIYPTHSTVTILSMLHWSLQFKHALHFILVNVFHWRVTEQATEHVILNRVQVLIQKSRGDSSFVGYDLGNKLLWNIATYKSMRCNITEDIKPHLNCYDNLKSNHKHPFLYDYLSMLKPVLQLNIYSILAPICFRKQSVFIGLLSQFLSPLHNHFNCWMTEK